jgi:hypothetical protein
VTAEQFIAALAGTESSNDPNAPLGDDGRALGRFQVHPDWVCTYALLFSRRPLLNETWDAWITALVRLFFQRYSPKNTAVQVAMWFHLGHFATEESSDWDAPYAERFNQWAAKVS